MKSLILLLIGMNLLFNNLVIKTKTTDIKVVEVVEKRTKYNGIYYHYEIKNNGNTIIPAKSFKVFFIVN